jgi:hypothetical protein
MNDPAASSGVSGFSRNLSAASGGEWTRRSFKKENSNSKIKS